MIRRKRETNPHVTTELLFTLVFLFNVFFNQLVNVEESGAVSNF